MIKTLKYLAPLSFYLISYWAFTKAGWWCWLPLVYAFGLIPMLEVILKPDTKNLTEAESELAKKSMVYDLMLYLFLPLQYLFLFLFLDSLQQEQISTADTVGRVVSMGLLCGIFGINVAHELGHRVKPYEIFFAKALLATSLYMHFYIEHNKGHHKRVATPEDPSSARKNENVYFFWIRSICFSYLSAWHIAAEDCKRKKRSVFGLSNEMIQAHLLQGMLLTAIAIFFGWKGLLCFFLSALFGILLLETVNYIEHYGLTRKKGENGNYERALAIHSWNSSHPLGRMMLFELSRHSDHHYLASKKYQLLEHHEDAPQLPTGYPGSMLLSLIPPLWFGIMNKRIMKMAS